MNTLLLAPHYDDEILFASFTILRHKPAVWTVFAPSDREERDQRIQETGLALDALGCHPGTYWVGGYEGEGSTHSLGEQLRKVRPPAKIEDRLPNATYFDHVFAPAVYGVDGHSEHEHVGEIALAEFGTARVTCYHTYNRRIGRVKDGAEVAPLEPSWIQMKLRALACFRSQIEHPARRPWFYDMLDMREWYA